MSVTIKIWADHPEDSREVAAELEDLLAEASNKFLVASRGTPVHEEEWQLTVERKKVCGNCNHYTPPCKCGAPLPMWVNMDECDNYGPRTVTSGHNPRNVHPETDAAECPTFDARRL